MRDFLISEGVETIENRFLGILDLLCVGLFALFPPVVNFGFVGGLLLLVLNILLQLLPLLIDFLDVGVLGFQELIEVSAGPG